MIKLDVNTVELETAKSLKLGIFTHALSLFLMFFVGNSEFWFYLL
jgi:hypothetical protein